MKKLLLPILALTVLFGCKKEDHNFSNSSNASTPVTVTEKKDINQASILPEAMEYYKNIAYIADWYAEHPGYNQKTNSSTDGDTANALLSKLAEFTILDSNNVERSIFEISKEERTEFLDTWAIIEANDLSNKLKVDTSQNSLGLISERNEAFKQAFGTSNKSIAFETEDPYWKVRRIMDLNEKKKQEMQGQTFSSFKTLSTDDTFWATVIANGLMSSSLLLIAPITLSPQTFVDRIRSSVSPGRLLIALPGGWETSNPIVFYPNKLWYDVGHVAVMSKNAWEVPGTINDEDNLTLGTDSEKGMHKELIKESWCDKHGLAFVGQVFDIKWITKYNYIKIAWITIKTPYYVQEARDVDNNALYNQALGIYGKPYCNAAEVLVAKWAAPGRFICSTTAWWCAKQSAGVNIGDFYKPTIFPAGVYLSDRVRIIDNTLN